MNLCLSLAEADLDSLLAAMNRHAGSCPYIEVRLDALQQPEVPPLPGGTPTRWIATCRPPREGGMFRGGERDRLALLVQAASSGFDFIDLEADVPTPGDLPTGIRIIRSRHLLDAFPGRPADHLPATDRPGDVAKLAVAVGSTREAVELLRWMSAGGRGDRVILGMGEPGQITRYLGAFLGNAWTYVSLAGRKVAPGQFTLQLAGEIFANWQGPSSPIYGVLGNPVAHSLSPALHNHLLRLYGEDGVYLPLCVDAVGPLLDWSQESGLEFRGFSVTMPHKLAAAEWLPGLPGTSTSPINTLSSRGGGWRGLNTDRDGFLQPLLERTPLATCKVVVLGTGGAARTVIEALTAAGALPLVVGRSRPVLLQLERQYGCQTAHWSELPISGQILVNATPVGQYPETDVSPWNGYGMDFEVVYDLIYRPQKTRLLRSAEDAGIQIISGIEMFVRQAALQFQDWTGIEPDRDEMTRFLNDRLISEGLED